MKNINLTYRVVLILALTFLIGSEINLIRNPIQDVVVSGPRVRADSSCYKYTTEANSEGLDFLFIECLDHAYNDPQLELQAHYVCMEEMKKYQFKLNQDFSDCVLADSK